MTQNIIMGVIVILCAIWAVRYFRKVFKSGKKNGGSCCCSESGGCGSGSSNSDCSQKDIQEK